MVSVTVLVVVVLLVIEPWVKFGTTGTAPTPCGVSAIITPTAIARIRFIAHDYLSWISVTNWPVAEVPAPPAVTVVTPELKIVPANVPATPPDIVKVSP